jgi:hypothetical protein
MPWLEYGGRLRKLPEGAAMVGAGPGVDVMIEGADLLPRHFMVEPTEAGIRLRPHTAESVVAIDGRQIGSGWCSADYGAIISAGSGHFRVFREPSTSSRTDVGVAPDSAFLVDTAHGLSYPLDHRSTNIGRARTNHVHLSDPTASRFHAQVRREAGGWVLHPSGSSGVQVNGHRVGIPRLLEDGDELDLAFQAFRFVRGPAPAGTRIVPRSAEGDSSRSERPTVARERITMVPPSARGRHPISRRLLVGLLMLFLLAALLIPLLG